MIGFDLRRFRFSNLSLDKKALEADRLQDNYCILLYNTVYYILLLYILLLYTTVNISKSYPPLWHFPFVGAFYGGKPRGKLLGNAVMA